jgi:HEAT repeat protein
LARRTGEESAAVRKAFRTSLARAVRAPRAEPALATLLADATLPAARTFELLRAGGSQLGQPALATPAEEALARLAPADAPFESRYLAIGPAGILAMSGREKSLARLQGALADADLRVRVEAVRALGSLPSQRARVLGLVRDPEPRVRQALASALRVLDDQPARQALLALAGDEWTFVRTAAVDSLAGVTADPAVDTALLAALPNEKVPAAQLHLIDAVAVRRLFAAGPRLLALASGQRTMLDVRARATVALGRVCHAPSVPALVELANRGLAPFAERDDATLGHAAVAALARLDVADVAAKLSPEARKLLPEIKAVLDPEDRCQAAGRTASLGPATREAASALRTW